MRHAAKVDENHAAIVRRFRELGYSVLSLAALGKGAPDLLVARGGVNTLVEVKRPKKQPNALQQRWHSLWAAPVRVVRTVEEVEGL
jgi:Holliday junction resolvase